MKTKYFVVLPEIINNELNVLSNVKIFQPNAGNVLRE